MPSLNLFYDANHPEYGPQWIDTGPTRDPLSEAERRVRDLKSLYRAWRKAEPRTKYEFLRWAADSLWVIGRPEADEAKAAVKHVADTRPDLVRTWP